MTVWTSDGEIECDEKRDKIYLSQIGKEIPLQTYRLIQSFGGTIDQNNRLHLKIACDGTIIFLNMMVNLLRELECTDIEVNGNKLKYTSPHSCLFEASGVLPKDLVVKVGSGEED